MVEYKDSPIADLLREMKRQIALGADVFFKWTCGKCGERVTADEPNTINPAGYYHTERADGSYCGALTKPTAGNLLTVMERRPGAGTTHSPSTPSADSPSD